MNYQIFKLNGTATTFFDYVSKSRGQLPDAIFTPDLEFVPISEIKFITQGSDGSSLRFLEATRNGKFVGLHLCFAANEKEEILEEQETK